MEKKFLAIIPARKGSIRLVDKNIKILNGKPLIAYTIEAATQAGIFDEVIVSTDSDVISKISEQYGAYVPFKRPEVLSGDKSTSIDVVLHALDFFADKNITFENVVLLQPTSPMRSAEDIISSVKQFNKLSANSVTSVCETSHSPLWSNTLDADLSMNDFLRPEVMNKSSQELAQYYRLNGAIYICKVEELRNKRKFIFEKNSFAYLMTQENSVDFDEEIDFLWVEFLLNSNS